MKVKFLKSGNGIGLGYFAGDEADLTEADAGRAIKEKIAEPIASGKKEKADADKAAAEKAEAEKIAAEKAEADRLAKEKADADKAAAADKNKKK
jgi:hypothetical protein